MLQLWLQTPTQHSSSCSEVIGLHQLGPSPYCRNRPHPDIVFVRFCFFKTNKIHDRDDEVDHVLLLQILYRKIKCKETMCLLRRWLRVPTEINGKLVKRRKGVPQEGGTLRKHPVGVFSERAS